MAAGRLEGLRSGYLLADQLWRESTTRLFQGELACRTGCFGCCLGLFEISLAEAVLVRAAFQGLSTPAREAARDRATRIVNASAAAFPGDAAAGILDPERTDEDDERYFAVVSHAACPFLELPSGRCQIYESRPITCRTFGLAWKQRGELVHPPCVLNLVGSTTARVLETAVDVGPLLAEDQRMAASLGKELPAGAGTTMAHALVGTAFEALELPRASGGLALRTRSRASGVRRPR